MTNYFLKKLYFIKFQLVYALFLNLHGFKRTINLVGNKVKFDLFDLNLTL